MRRRMTGRYEITAVGGERVRAFVPAPLPPEPPLRLEGELARRLERATAAVGRLDALAELLPDPDLFLYTYVRREAVLSSQIEGTQSSLSDLLLFELDAVPGVPLDDVREVSCHVAAMEHGLRRLAEGFPLSNRLLREMHARLLAHGRGSDRAPGEFRRSQNWIGGTRPGNAVFVPPPPHLVPDCMAELERFLHARDQVGSSLVRAGLAHVQFETIHPFLDGNGRMGRLLTTLLLCHDGLLSRPLLYLSLYLNEHRREYYRLLDGVRREGRWEEWLTFFLAGVEETANDAATTARRLQELVERDRERIRNLGRAAGSVLRVHDALAHHPLATARVLRERTGLAMATVNAALRRLEELGVVRETTGKARGRLFGYGEYLNALGEMGEAGAGERE